MNNHLLLKNNIRQYRKQLNINQSTLAFEVGVSQNTISNLEIGLYSPSAYLACKLCKYFNCTFDDLFFLVDNID